MVTGKDKTDEFDPTQLHCLNGYERNERGECVGKIRFYKIIPVIKKNVFFE